MKPKADLSLSPSRVDTYTRCPQLYRFKYLDKIEEPSSPDAERGTRVHTVLERLYGLPPAERTLAAALAFAAEDPATTPLDAQAIAGAFELEDPTKVPVAARERDVGYTITLDGRTVWAHGIIDRLDRLPAGYGVTDWKCGKVPGERYAAKSLWQGLFYALVWWRYSSHLPVGIQFLYVTHRERLWIAITDERQLEVVENRAREVAAAILTATATDHWPATTNPLCGWCWFKDHGCPAWT